jgi:hypothetical protein
VAEELTAFHVLVDVKKLNRQSRMGKQVTFRDSEVLKPFAIIEPLFPHSGVNFQLISPNGICS